jgi:tetratricopeptide (TPR) repeat protein
MNAYDESLPPAAEFKDTSKKFVWALAILLVLGLAGFFSARPVYRLFKTRRALGLATEVEANIKAGNWDDALHGLKVILELAPTNPRVLRLAAEYCTRLSLMDGLNYWEMLLKTPEATRQDLLQYLDLCLNFNRTDITGPQLEGMLATNRDDPDLLRLWVRSLHASATPSQAVAAARHWLEVRPADDESQFTLGMLLNGSTNADERAEGRRLLWGVAVGQGKLHPDAVDALAASPDLTSAECQVLLKSLAGRTDRRLTVLRLQVRVEPDRRAELVEAFAQAARTAESPVALAEAATWFADTGEVDRVLEILPPEKVAKHPGLLTARLQALLEKNRLVEVQPYLDMDNPPVEPYMLHCLQALAAQKSGRPQLVLGHFESALAACTNQLNKLQFVAGYAERIGQPRAAAAAYQRLMQYPSLALFAGREMLRLLAPLDDAKASREVLRRLERTIPGDESIFLASTYFGFLLGERLPGAMSTLEKDVKDHPENALYRTVLALGALRNGDAPKALGLVEGIEIDWSKAESRMRAIYAATLGANQQREAARQIARKIDLSTLRSEEKELIKEWL